MLDTYETQLGIFNHEVAPPDRELAIVAFHPAEDAHTDSLLYERIEQVGQKKVHQYFGIPLDRLLEMPRDVVMKILEECEKIAQKESKSAETALGQINQLGSKS